MVAAAQLLECRIEADTGAVLQQDHHLSFSVSMLKRLLRQNGSQHLSPLARPTLLDSHKPVKSQVCQSCPQKRHNQQAQVAEH